MAAAEAILGLWAGSDPTPVMSSIVWDFVREEIAWVGERTAHCTAAKLARKRGTAYLFELQCGEGAAFLEVHVVDKQVQTAFLWSGRLQPGPHAARAIQELGQLTRDGELTATAAIWDQAWLSEKLPDHVAKLQALGACEVGRLWAGGRQHASYVFDCEHGGAVVGVAVHPNGQIMSVDVRATGLATLAPRWPSWVDPDWFSQ
jgi:hypothetical protein